MSTRETETVREQTKKNAPVWLKVFVAFHIVAITSWSLPAAPPKYEHTPPRVRTDSPVAFTSSAAEYLRTEFLLENQRLVKESPVKVYLLSTGFWQYWDMFAPNPSNTDIYADAVITFADGSKKTYQYPRVYELPITEKFMKERFRKFFERGGDPQFSYLWPDFAQRVALTNFDDPANPPTKVELHKHSFVIAPPGVAENRDYSDKLYYTYAVDLERLRKDKGL